jgi:hypothetical protein
MEWMRGGNFLEKVWLNFRNFFVTIGYATWHGLLAAVEAVWHGLEVGWIETISPLSKTWTPFTGWGQQDWHWCRTQLVQAWNWVRKRFASGFDAEATDRRRRQDLLCKESQDRTAAPPGHRQAGRPSPETAGPIRPHP